MATDTNILREFLVSLGFKVENAERFQQSIENATKQIAKFGVALEGMGIAALAALNKVASKYRDLEYASQRLNGTPIRSIMAFQQAMKLSGTTVEDARSSLENFGDFLRTNPNALNILHGLGISTTDAQGKLRSVTDMFYQFGNIAKNWQAQGRLYQARGYAEMFGISSESLDAAMRNPANKARDYLKELNKRGLTDEEIKKRADAMARWAQRWDDFIGKLVVFSDMWVSKIQPIFDALLNWVNMASEKTHGLSTDFLALGAALIPIMAVTGPITAGIVGIVGALALLWSDFEKWDNGGKSVLPWNDWAPELRGIQENLKELGKALSDVFGSANLNGLGQSIKQFVKDSLGAVKDVLASITDALKAIKSLQSKKPGEAWGHVVDAFKNFGKAFEPHNEKPEGPAHPGGQKSGGKDQNVGPVSLTGNGVAAQIYNFFKARGLSPDKIRGIMSGIFAESGFNSEAHGPMTKYGRAFGIGQWLGDRADKLHAMFGDKPSLAQQLQFLWMELTGGDKGGRSVLGANGADATLGAYITQYMRPAAGAETNGDFSRGRAWLAKNPSGSFQQVNVNTNIYVNGSGDPNQTAQAVARQQQRVYGNATRYNKPAAS